MTADLHIDAARLLARIEALAAIGPNVSDDGLHRGSCRLALTDDDRRGRDLVTMWMRDLGLDVSIDHVGNVVGTWGVGSGAPIMCGSHIDTVRTGGRYDGNLGVLAGLEVIETCQQAGLTPSRPLAVAFFTNEEGARFAPDMLGSLAYAGGLTAEDAHDIVAIDGARLGDELARIGYLGPVPCPGTVPAAFVELHVEQGPVLEATGHRIGAVTGVQGISWTEVTIVGQSNHAGTTPMNLRRDPMYVAAEITTFVRRLANDIGGRQVGTVGRIEPRPNLVNVVAASVVMTVDLRNTDNEHLRHAEALLAEFLAEVAEAEQVEITTRSLARFDPVEFDPRVIELVEQTARQFGQLPLTMPSGAGHDAQMMARVCPTAMIFVPSVKGLSHNPAEHTDPADLALGADVLLHVMLALAETGSLLRAGASA
ncbi:MAG: Zn-dependent hydrolase [Acidimicrobiia bacterium]